MNDVTKQIQKGGDNSQQIQAGTVIIGIDEKRAREIYREMFEISRRDFSQEAYQIATKRVSQFEEKLIPKMQKIVGALNNFADPSFQLLLSKAHKTAASTEREVDYELLSELLIHHVKTPHERKIKASINKAVEIIDQIDDDALCALTVTHGALSLSPKDKNIINGLQVLDNLFGKLIYDDLPITNDWIDHLEILGAVRISSVLSGVDIISRYAKYFSVDSYTGIKKESQNYQKAIELLSLNNLPIDFLQNNELNDDYVRLPALTDKDVDTLMWVINPFTPNQIEMTPTAEQIAVFHQIWDMYDNSSEIKNMANNNFKNLFNNYKNLAKLNDWWKSIRHNFSITAVGKVLAHANAQRLDSAIPPLE